MEKKKAYKVAGTSVGIAVLAAGVLTTFLDNGNKGAQAVTPELRTASPVTINVATYEGQGTSLTDQQNIAKAYMKLHPNVKINVISIPSNYSQKILTEIAAGQAPDIFQIGDGDVSMFAAKKAIVDLQPLLVKNHVNLKAYYPSVLNTGRVHGDLYTLPKDWSDLAVYYNKKLFKQVHLALPTANWTWAQFAADAKKLTVKHGSKTVQWGAQLPGDWTRAVEPLVFSYGGKVIGPNGTYTGYLNNKNTAKALSFYANIYNSGSAPSPSTVNGFQGVDLFQAGKVAMNVTGDWPEAGYKTTPGLSFGTVPLPKGPAGAANTICYSGWGISTQSQNQQASFDYLKYLAGVQGESQLTNYSLVSMPALAKNSGQTTDPYLSGFLKGIPDIKTLPDLISPYWNQSGATQFQAVLDKMLLGKPINIQAELNSAAKAADQASQQAQSQ